MPGIKSPNSISDISLEEAHLTRRRFRLILLASIATVGVGTVAMYYLEGLSWIDGLYFSVVSLTTVGYGDITPETTAGKAFVVVYLLVGIAIVAALLNTILRNAMARRVIRHNQEEQD